ncbi:MAG: hypothetical protein ACLQVI_07815 [Polyangiaceae bacterium]|jgi:hypothetical protein
MSDDPAKRATAGTVGKSLGSGFRARMPGESPASGVRSASAEVSGPVPTGWTSPRPRLESEPGMTQIGSPPASLLALARGEADEAAAGRKAPKPRRVLWFVLGLMVGVGGTSAAKGELSADVYRARMWIASSLRAVRAHGGENQVVATTTAAAPTGAPVVIPTVDVSELPRVKEEPAQAPSGGPTSVASPPAPGAPALQHAPGPR